MNKTEWAEYKAKYLNEDGTYNATFWMTLVDQYGMLMAGLRANGNPTLQAGVSRQIPTGA